VFVVDIEVICALVVVDAPVAVGAGVPVVGVVVVSTPNK